MEMFNCRGRACVCDVSPTEDRYGRDGKDNLWNEDDVPEDTDLFPGESNWSELEPLYRLDEHAYDLKLNFTLSLEDWAHFSRSVDHMFTLLSNDNQPYSPPRPEDEQTGRGHALVSSSQSASAIYLTTLATPALLLKEAGAEVLRHALGLNQQERPSSSSPSSSSRPTRPVGSQMDNAGWEELKGDRQKEARDGDEEEEFVQRRTGKLSSTHCDCNDILQETVWLSCNIPPSYRPSSERLLNLAEVKKEEV